VFTLLIIAYCIAQTVLSQDVSFSLPSLQVLGKYSICSLSTKLTQRHCPKSTWQHLWHNLTSNKLPTHLF